MSVTIINQAWEDVADDVTGAIEKAVQPLLKKAVDDIYGGLLDATQDYLKDNLAFNIASRISTAEREASDARRQVKDLAESRDDLLFALCALTNAIDGCVDPTPDLLQKAKAAISRALGTPASDGEE